jgi:hypothetical protein
MSMRGTLTPTAESGRNRRTASFPNHLSYYDPHVQRVRTAADLQKVMRDSDEQGKPLYVTAYHPWGVVFGSPDVWRLFYESGLFVDFVVHHGMDNAQDRVVARYQPGAIEGFDLEEFLRSNKSVPNPLGPPTSIRKNLHCRKGARRESNEIALGQPNLAISGFCVPGKSCEKK